MCAFYLYSLDYNARTKIFEILKFDSFGCCRRTVTRFFVALALCRFFSSSLCVFIFFFAPFLTCVFISVLVYLCIFLLWTIVLQADIATATYSLSPFSSFVRWSCVFFCLRHILRSFSVRGVCERATTHTHTSFAYSDFFRTIFEVKCLQRRCLLFSWASDTNPIDCHTQIFSLTVRFVKI